MMFKTILIIIFCLFNDNNNNNIIKVRKNLPDDFKYFNFKSSFHILIVNFIIFYLENVIILTYL